MTQKKFDSLKAFGSDYIARKVATDDSLSAQNVTNLERYAQISHWAWTAYSDRALRSDLLRSIISGGISGPNMSEIVSAVDSKDKFAWHMPSIFEAELNRFSGVLESDAFKGSIQGYAGNFGVEDILGRIPQ